MMVSVIIVNYNTFSITCDCIASVIEHTRDVPYEIVLVDNASPDDDPDEFLKRFPNITLVKSPVNGGFAKGNNLGIALAKGDIILLLNSDTWLVEDSISKAANQLRRYCNIGALTVKLTYPDGRLQHTARKFRSVKNELLDLARPILKLMPYEKRAKLMLNQYFNGDFNVNCDWVSGAFMMFNSFVLPHFPDGKLDERYFMYGEDQLWCYQLKEAGLRNYYFHETTVIHINQASTKPSKQMAVLQRIIHLETDFYKYRKGAGLSYWAFMAVFIPKEYARLVIKLVAMQVLGKQL